MSFETCSTCAFWGVGLPGPAETYRTCRKIRADARGRSLGTVDAHEDGTPRGPGEADNTRTFRARIPAAVAGRASSPGDGDHAAAFRTRRDFGCNQWQSRAGAERERAAFWEAASKSIGSGALPEAGPAAPEIVDDVIPLDEGEREAGLEKIARAFQEYDDWMRPEITVTAWRARTETVRLGGEGSPEAAYWFVDVEVERAVKSWTTTVVLTRDEVKAVDHPVFADLQYRIVCQLDRELGPLLAH